MSLAPVKVPIKPTPPPPEVAGNFTPKGPTRNFGKGQKNKAQNIKPWEGATHVWVDAKAYIWGYDGNVYDVSSDIVTGNITRQMNAPTKLTLTINNQGNKYYQLFIPMDRIRVHLRRGEQEWISFTGYISKTPMYNLVYSQQISLEAEDIIRILKNKYWDPNLLENVIMMSYLPSAASMSTPDMTLAYLLTAPDQVGFKPENVYIQQFPEAWTRAALALNEANLCCTTLWDDLITCEEDTLGEAAEGGEGESTGEEDGPADGYPGDTSPEIACWMADEAESRGVPGALPVMTALVESQMQNLGYGDRDSLGYFQQRPSQGWGSADQIMDPNYSLGKFLDAAAAADMACSSTDANCLGQWAQAVQRSAFPDRYAERYDEAMKLISNCGSDTGGDTDSAPVGEGQGPGAGAENVMSTSSRPLPSRPSRTFDTPGYIYGNTPGTYGGPARPSNLQGDPNFNPRTTPPRPSGPGHQGGGSSHYLFGVEDGFILAPFGARNPVQGSHKGVDIESRLGRGAKIKAIRSGTVRQAPRCANGCGCQTVVIQYDNGPMTLYCHNSRALVKEGDKVKEGDVLAEVGCEDACARYSPNDPHVHIQTVWSDSPNDVFDWSKCVDPAIALNIDERGSDAMHRGRHSLGPVQASILPGQDILQNESSLKQMIRDGLTVIGAPFRWAGGHDEVLTVEDMRVDGADATGLFNVLRGEAGLEPAEIGAAPQWANFLENTEAFKPGKNYPPGTILINPGGGTTPGHMAMVIDLNGHVLQADASGYINAGLTIQQANRGWSGFTIAGVMPDTGVLMPRRENVGTNEGIGAGQESVGSTTMGVPGGNLYHSNNEHIPGYPLHGGYHSGVDVGAETGTPIYAWADGRVTSTGRDDVGQLYNYVWVEYPTEGGESYTVVYGHMGEISLNPGDSFSAGDRLGTIGTAEDGWGTPHVHIGVWEGNQTEKWDWETDIDPVPVFNAIANGDVAPDSNPRDVGPGSGRGSAGTSSDNEPCIMKNPLGPYRLGLQETATTPNSMMLREYILNQERFVTPYTKNLEYTLGYYYSRSALRENDAKCTEERDWGELAELYKEPYLKAISEIAKSGMYTFQTIGTGELVFWYPFYVDAMSDYVFNTPGGAEDRPPEVPVVGPTEGPSEGAGAEDIVDSPGIGAGPNDAPKEGTKTLRDQEAMEEAKESGAIEDMTGVDMRGTNVEVLLRPMIIEDVELLDFHISLSDDLLVTHYYMLGDYRMEGQPQSTLVDWPCWRWSTIRSHPIFKARQAEGVDWDPDAFLQRYGVRPKQEMVPAIKTAAMGQIWADHKFLIHWLNCYTIEIDVAYLPEVYPGQKIEVKSLGVESICMQSSITFGNQWSTNITCSMPLAVGDESKIPPLPFWSLITKDEIKKGMDPTKPPEGMDPSWAPKGVPLHETGDMDDDMQRFKDDNKKLQDNFLKDWADKRNEEAKRPGSRRRRLEKEREDPRSPSPEKNPRRKPERGR